MRFEAALASPPDRWRAWLGVPDPLGRHLALELGEGQEHVQRQPSHAGRGVEALRHRDKGGLCSIQPLDDLGEVCQRPGHAIDLVDHDLAHQPRIDNCEQTILAVVSVGLDRVIRLRGPPDPVPPRVVGVGAAGVLGQLVVGVGGVEGRQVRGEPVALRDIGVVLDRDRHPRPRDVHPLGHLHQAIEAFWDAGQGAVPGFPTVNRSYGLLGKPATWWTLFSAASKSSNLHSLCRLSHAK